MSANVPIKDIIFWSIVTRLVICLYKPMSDEECPYPIPWWKHIPMVPIKACDMTHGKLTNQPSFINRNHLFSPENSTFEYIWFIFVAFDD